MRPAQVAGTEIFHGFALGYHSSCALSQDSTAYCWGDSQTGVVGNGTNDFFNPAPVPVSGARRFFALTSARFSDHACGVAADSLAYCWGSNPFGELGDGTTEARNVPTAVVGGLKFAAISAGGHYTCGLTGGGQVYCWGSYYGFDRVGEPAQPNPTLIAAPGATFMSIAVGTNHACALTVA